MKYLVTGNEMKLLDKNTSEYFHIPTVVLMERAAVAFIDEFLEYVNGANKILVVCGCGNNGADGIAIARLLNQKGLHTDIYLIEGNYEKNSKKGSELYQLQKKIYLEYEYGYIEVLPKRSDYDVVIEAIFGIGLSRNVEGKAGNVIECLNGYPCKKVAVDMPAGVSTDTGRVMGIAFKANLTITFAFGKIGQFLWPGSEYCGKVVVTQMGITLESLKGKKPAIQVIEQRDLQNLPKRKAHSNKGTYGKLLIVAGTLDMAGAAVLSAKAALSCGVGLVKIFTREENRVIIQSTIPEAIIVTYTKDAAMNENKLLKEVQWADAVVLGPGIGTDATAHRIVDFFLKVINKPMIVDADALNILAEYPVGYDMYGRNKIITPHLGEMSRLTRQKVADIQENLLETAKKAAEQFGTVCVLKDFHTVTVAANTDESYLNLSGNNGMATAGSGDVLSGVIGSLLAQGVELDLAASYGVYIHGAAGNQIKSKTGTHAMKASDIIDGLSLVWRQVEEDQTEFTQ